MRNIFIEELTKEAKKNKKIILIVNDLGYSVIENFAKLFPKQFFNAGVAEQNMLGLAAGLALGGNQVYVYSIGNFPTFRCAEQIRNDIDYHNLPVTIVNVGSGVNYGNLGYSHHAIQDYGLLRLFPNMLIASPGDNFETRECMKYLLKNPQPSYLRLAKTKKDIFKRKDKIVSPGSWIRIDNKKNKSFNAILCTGNTLYVGKEMIQLKKYKNFNLYTLPMWGMKYKVLQSKYLSRLKHLITIEDHIEDGGFSSWIKESAKEKINKIKITSKYFDSKIVGKVGSEKYLREKYFNKI